MPKKELLPTFYPSSATLKEKLAAFPAGVWVAIATDQQRVVGSGPTASRAEKKAAASGSKATVLLQIPARDRKSVRPSNGGHELSTSMPLNLPSFYRGIYKRVAGKLGCDPSYVSRVARGERASEQVSQALQSELSHAVALTAKSATRLRRGQAS